MAHRAAVLAAGVLLRRALFSIALTLAVLMGLLASAHYLAGNLPVPADITLSALLGLPPATIVADRFIGHRVRHWLGAALLLPTAILLLVLDAGLVVLFAGTWLLRGAQ